MTHEYVIPLIPPSMNRFLGRENSHEYRDMKKSWLEIVWAHCRPKPPKPIERARVTLTYCFDNHQRRDPDNYAGKMILDGLKEAKIIVDARRHYSRYPRRERVKPRRVSRNGLSIYGV